MSTALLPLRPLTAPHPGALVAPQHDPRPCVTRPAQWWDTGNPGNARAIRYCRNVCPLRATCKPVGKPKDQIIAGRAYNHAGKRLTICGRCDHPRARPSNGGAIRCGCPTPGQQAAQRKAEREARRQAKLAAQQAKARQLHGAQLVDVWVPLHCAGLNIREAAERLGVRHDTLRNALHRARSAGDRRVPHFRAARTHRPVAA